jgi:hypothetical protein
MAGFWGMYSHRRKDGNCYLQDPNVVHLCLLFNNGFSFDRLYDHGFLDEHEKIHTFCPQKPVEILIK